VAAGSTTVAGTAIRGGGAAVINTVAVRPRFSVVIPVHNRAEVVGRAVASVLAQTFADLEVVVVDDGSGDDSVAAARAVADARVRIVRQEHAGVDTARANGVRRARGAWILYLDPEDELAPGLLARFGRLIDSTDAGIVSCAGDQLYADGSRTTFAPVPVELRPGTTLDLVWGAEPRVGVTGHGPRKACFRTGAFATTRERLRSVGAFVDDAAEPLADLLGAVPEPVVLHSTVHSAGHGALDAVDPLDDAGPLRPETLDRTPTPRPAPAPAASGAASALASELDLDLAEIGRRVVASVVEDGLEVVHTPESLVCWYEPTPGDHASGGEGDELRLRWARQGIDALARTPIPDGAALARFATVGGVAAARLRDRRESRRLLRLARQAIPDEPLHWVRWAVAWVPPVADRVWEPTTGPVGLDDDLDATADGDAAPHERPGAEVLAG